MMMTDKIFAYDLCFLEIMTHETSCSMRLIPFVWMLPHVFDVCQNRTFLLVKHLLAKCLQIIRAQWILKIHFDVLISFP